MAGRPKDPTVNKKIYEEINRLLETTHFKKYDDRSNCREHECL